MHEGVEGQELQLVVRGPWFDRGGCRFPGSLANLNLERAGIFDARGSVDYVSAALGVSRASLYSLLKSVRKRA